MADVNLDLQIADRTLISYCFLAALNDNSTGLYDKIYLPICKRALSHYSQSKSSGHDIDLKQEILNLYGLNVPILTVRQMLRSLEGKLSKREKAEIDFAIFENGRSFQSREFAFTELEATYQQESRNANAIELAFEEYLGARQANLGEAVKKFVDFFDANKAYVLSFFSNTTQEAQLISSNVARFRYHAEFLQHISQNNHALYEIAQKLYLGSVVATYLESGIEVDQNIESSVTYYTDTQIILRALDLQDEGETEAFREVVKILRVCGSAVKVLDVSVDEIRHLLEQASYDFDAATLLANVKNYSIVHACRRRGLAKTDLQRVASNIENIINSELGITVERVPGNIKEKAREHSDTKELAGTRKTPANALHDVIAYLFVRWERGGSERSFRKARYWFVTPNKKLYQFNISKHEDGNIPEVITPEILTNFLWLKSPSSLGKKVARAGLAQLVSQTIAHELPGTEILRRLDKNIKQYVSCSPQDFELLISAVALQSVEGLADLNKLIEEKGAEDFNKKVMELIGAERERRILQEQERTFLQVEKGVHEAKASQLGKDMFILNQKLSSIEEHLIKTEGSLIAQTAKNKRLKDNLLYGRILLYGILTFIIVCIYLLISPSLANKLKLFFRLIVGLGGLWSFGNFGISLYRVIKRS